MTKRKVLLALTCLVMAVLFTIGGTIAWITVKTPDVSNTFKPSVVTCDIEEEFDGSEKTNVNVRNTGNTDAYLRVRLVTYRVNEAGQRIGGSATVPDFTRGEGWEYNEADGYYYYTKPVEPHKTPDSYLIGVPGITLEDAYADADGGKQVIEVIAEAIQAKGMGASGAINAWEKAKQQ